MLVVQVGFGLVPAGTVVCFDFPREAARAVGIAELGSSCDTCCEPESSSSVGFPVLMDHECPADCGCCIDVRVPDSGALVAVAASADHIFVHLALPLADVVFDLCPPGMAWDALPEPSLWPTIPKRAEIKLAVATGIESTLLLI